MKSANWRPRRHANCVFRATMLLDRNARLFVCFSLVLFAVASPALAKRRAAQPLTGIVEVQRVVVVILENADLAAAESQPYLSYLARHGSLLTSSRLVATVVRPV